MTGKLHGYDFFKQIGSPKNVIAPMVDQSELAWRLLGRKYSADLAYTPMFHAANFVRDPSYRRNAMEMSPDDRPLIYQFCSNDPDIFTEAAKLVQDHCDAVDLNLGCPQEIAKRGHYGSFLQNEWDLIEKMLTKCVQETNVPITAKIRAQSSIELTVQYARMIEKCGVSIITIHGRTREQRGVNTGLADWNIIKAVKEAVNVPVFANGNIQCHNDVQRCLTYTGADGVMSAEGHLHDPAIFAGVRLLVWEAAREYISIVRAHPCPMGYVRGHVFKLLHHALCCHDNNLREAVGSARTLEDFEAVLERLAAVCGPENCVSTPTGGTSSLPIAHWYCQAYTRPAPQSTPLNTATTNKRQSPLMDDDGSNTTIDVVKAQRAESKRRKTEARKLCKENEEKKRSGSVRAEPLHCEGCVDNQRGVSCEFNFCKSCCKKKRVAESITCSGHVQWRNGRVKKELNQSAPISL